MPQPDLLTAVRTAVPLAPSVKMEYGSNIKWGEPMPFNELTWKRRLISEAKRSKTIRISKAGRRITPRGLNA
jgi:hypothetical protein